MESDQRRVISLLVDNQSEMCIRDRSKDCQLYLKTENLQATGSFKVRGAYYKISQLSEEESAKGVIALSLIHI